MNSAPTLYTPAFYDSHHTRSVAAAKAIVPLLIKHLGCRSVVDLGCGTGTWLSVFLDSGVTDFLGVDGDYVQEEMLVIDRSKFVKHDLTLPLQVDRKYDLAISLEVAEHLESKAAESLVSTLTRFSDIILFSAAVPNQPGTGHVNGQWQSYWVKKFSEYGYEAVDCIRPNIWADSNVAYWYAQNSILYIRKELFSKIAELNSIRNNFPCSIADIIHPTHFDVICQENSRLRQFIEVAINEPSLRDVLRKIPVATWRAVRNRMLR